MKKLLLFILILSIQSGAFAKSYLDAQLKNVKKNEKYNSVQIHEKNYIPLTEKITPKKNLPDPELITLSKYKEISDELYNKKLEHDEIIYNNEIIPALKMKTNSVNVEPSAVDFYNLYRISEKLIRANNLDYTNWLISVRKTQDLNAYSTGISHIVIYTPLYDSFYGNEDALAYILAHEMSHLILGHQEQKADIIKKIKTVRAIKSVNPNAANTNGFVIAKYYRDLRDLEFMADIEALILISKAGYSPDKAFAVLNTFDALPEIKSLFDDHPMTKDRIANYKENVELIDPNWKNIGKENIYNSNVLNCKKSSDRVSIVINKSDNPKDFYEVEDVKARLKRFAYMSYVNGKYKNAIKYFSKLSKMNEKDYIPYVYIGLSNYEMYKQLNNKKYLKRSNEAFEKAKNLSPNKDIINDITDKISL